jgi:hypothetical protein
MASQGRQQYWTREAIESIKASIRRQAQLPVLKPAHPQAEIIDGGCLLYHLPTSTQIHG